MIIVKIPSHISTCRGGLYEYMNTLPLGNPRGITEKAPSPKPYMLVGTPLYGRFTLSWSTD